MSRIAEYELKLDWVRVDDVSEDKSDPTGEIYGNIYVDKYRVWTSDTSNVLGGTASGKVDMRAGDFFQLTKDRSSLRHFDDEAPDTSPSFALKIQLSEADDWNPDDVIAKVNEEIRPNRLDFGGKSSVTIQNQTKEEGSITYQYTVTRLG
ncbi:MAG TPA: hypothetical protein VFH94_15275 [Streptomyces sp.]|nr:hypothetical protein [Streptomyces sp.]